MLIKQSLMMHRPFVLTLSHPADATLRTARRTPGGSALPAAGGSQKGSKTCSKRPLPTVGSLLDFKQAAIQAKGRRQSFGGPSAGQQPAGCEQPVRTKQPAMFRKIQLLNLFRQSPVGTSTLPLADLVVMAGRPHPFPFRTRP